MSLQQCTEILLWVHVFIIPIWVQLFKLVEIKEKQHGSQGMSSSSIYNFGLKINYLESVQL